MADAGPPKLREKWRARRVFDLPPEAGQVVAAVSHRGYLIIALERAIVQVDFDLDLIRMLRFVHEAKVGDDELRCIAEGLWRG